MTGKDDERCYAGCCQAEAQLAACEAHVYERDHDGQPAVGDDHAQVRSVADEKAGKGEDDGAEQGYLC